MEILMPIKNVNENRRNYTLDALKAFFAVMVILVHFPFQGELGHITSNIGICGVILFFLISGYSSYNQDDSIASENILRRFKRNGITFLIVLLIYFIFAIVEFSITNQFRYLLFDLKDPWRYLRLFLLGDLTFIHADPLWFMIALLYSYLILYLLHKFKVMKYAYYTLPIFLLFRIFVECYVNTYNTDWHYSSFFLASGFPIMLLGNYVACKKESFLKAPIYITVILASISTVFMFITIHIKVFGYDIAQIFKIWCMFEIFILALKLPGKKDVPILSKMGKKYSSYIYYFHYLIGFIIIDIMFIKENPEWVYDWLLPIFAVIFGVLVPIALYELNHKIKSKLKVIN